VVESLYSAVRTDSLYTADYVSFLKGSFYTNHSSEQLSHETEKQAAV